MKPPRFAMLLLAVASVSSVFFFLPRLLGLFSTGDGEGHHDAAVEFARSLSDGIVYPSWSEASFDSRGSPVFLVYAPVFHYLFTALQWLTGDSWRAYFAIEALAPVLTLFIVVALLRRHGVSALAALAFGVATSYSPFVYMNSLYVQGAPWHLAYPALALIVLGISQVTESRLQTMLLFAVGIGFTATTHFLSIFMIALCLPLAAASNVRFCNRLDSANRRTLVELMLCAVLGAICGALVAGFYVWPALTLVDLTNEAHYARDVDWRTGFALPVVTTARWPVYQYGMGALLLGMLILATWMAFRLRDIPTRARLATVSLVSIAWTAMVLSSELAYPLWEVSQHMRKVQYAYRFYCIGFLAVTPALAILATYYQRGSWLRLAAHLTPAVTILFSAIIMVKYTLIDSRPLSEISNPGEIASFGAFLPASAPVTYRNHGGEADFVAECAELGASCVETSVNAEDQRWEIDSPAAWRAKLPLFAFPFWDVTVNGTRVEPSVDSSTGLIELDLPDGQSLVRANWRTPQPRRTGKFMSFAGLLMLAVTAIVLYGRDRTRMTVSGAGLR